MKKGIIALLLAGVIMGGGYYVYDQNYGTEDYYTKITTDGEKVISKSDDGQSFNRYRYNLESYKDASTSKSFEFDSVQDKPLKKEAYLKLKINEKKGVMGWEETASVPKEIKEKLDNV